MSTLILAVVSQRVTTSKVVISEDSEQREERNDIILPYLDMLACSQVTTLGLFYYYP